jgi:predicted Fe-Mo cluster-binding NifX family protein
MKIIITAKGKNLDASVDPRFGRAQYLLLYDTEDKSFSVLDNSENLDAAQGVGIQVGQTVVNSGASVLITGNCGPKAFYVLNSGGVKVYTGAKGTVKEAIEALEGGKLFRADSPNVDGHWK